MGYKVNAFCFQDSPRRAHSIAAQGGINAAKNYQNDGDSVHRLFYDTIKGGDYRAREANVHRLAECSTSIIDQCVAQGVPFAREYGGTLSNRSFGGTQVQRTFYAAGQTGQQLLLGAYSGLERQVGLGNVKMYARHEMVEVVKIDGKARGIIARDLVSGKLERHFGHAVLLCTGGYGNVFYLSTNAMGSNVTAAWKAHKAGAYFGNPCFTQIHPTCIPVSGHYQSKLTLMSESLRNDGRIWVPTKQNDERHPNDIPEDERDYYLERRYPAFGNLVPRDIASRAAKERCDAGYGVGQSKMAVYLDFKYNMMQRYGRTEASKLNIANPDDETLIRLGKDDGVKADPLFAHIFNRHTHRGVYENRIPNAQARQTLADSVKDFSVQLGLVTSEEASMQQHRAIAMDAWRIEMQTPHTLLESYKVLRVGPQEIAQHRDGISLNTPMVRGLVALNLFDRSKPSEPDSSAIKGQISEFNDKMSTTPACVWLSTSDNSRRTQMLCGRAYVRLQLAATALGLRMHPLSQALQEYPEQTNNYKAIHELLVGKDSTATVQMWTRLGYAPAGSPSPRRGLQAHFTSA